MRRHPALFAVVAGAVLVTAASLAQATDDGFWREWDAGLQEAEATGRPVVVDVYTTWCGWCRVMDRDVYGREDIRAYLEKHFVPVKLNAETPRKATYMGENHTWRSLAGRFQVRGFPTTIFLSSNGQHLVNVPGYVPADQFLTLLRYVGEGYMERGVTFREFQRQTEPGGP